jgi:hypothetical protein
LLAGANYYVRILSTLNRELLKPSSSVALHRHSNALVDILPPEADSSIAMLSDAERPDVTYHDIGGNDIQKQEIREAVELPLSNPGLYAQVGPSYFSFGCSTVLHAYTLWLCCTPLWLITLQKSPQSCTILSSVPFRVLLELPELCRSRHHQIGGATEPHAVALASSRHPSTCK